MRPKSANENDDWDVDNWFHEPVSNGSAEVWEQEYDTHRDTGLLDHRGQPILIETPSPKIKLGFHIPTRPV